APKAIFNWQRRLWHVSMMPDKQQRRALGRGLSALLPQKPGPATVESTSEPTPNASQVASLAVADIHPNPLQPRSTFDAARLEELSNSIKTHGIIQPILVRRRGLHYELIAG